MNRLIQSQCTSQKHSAEFTEDAPSCFAATVSRSQIADLTHQAITALSVSELANIIVLMSPAPVSVGAEMRLARYPRTSLENLVYHVRKICRDRGY